MGTGSLIHLGPDFTTSHTRSSCTTPDFILSNSKTVYNSIIKPEPLTQSDYIPIILMLTTSHNSLNLRNTQHKISQLGEFQRFKKNTKMESINTEEHMNTEKKNGKLKHKNAFLTKTNQII